MKNQNLWSCWLKPYVAVTKRVTNEPQPLKENWFGIAILIFMPYDQKLVALKYMHSQQSNYYKNKSFI